MCFSQPISLFFTIFGFALAQIYRYKNREWKDPNFWRFIICLDFFTSMEALQFVQYFWLDQCDSPINVFLTYLGFFHICLQPLVFNWGCSWRVSRHNRRVVDTVIVPLCLVFTAFFISRVFLADEIPCIVGVEPLCGHDTCTFMGSIHLTWRLKVRAANLWTPGGWAHHFMMFAPPLFTGNPGTAVFLFITGPIFAHFITDWHLSEWASIWCYFSILQITCAVGLAHWILWDKHMAARSLTLQKKELEGDIQETENVLVNYKKEHAQITKDWENSWENPGGSKKEKSKTVADT